MLTSGSPATPPIGRHSMSRTVAVHRTNLVDLVHHRQLWFSFQSQNHLDRSNFCLNRQFEAILWPASLCDCILDIIAPKKRSAKSPQFGWLQRGPDWWLGPSALSTPAACTAPLPNCGSTWHGPHGLDWLCGFVVARLAFFLYPLHRISPAFTFSPSHPSSLRYLRLKGKKGPAIAALTGLLLGFVFGVRRLCSPVFPAFSTLVSLRSSLLLLFSVRPDCISHHATRQHKETSRHFCTTRDIKILTRWPILHLISPISCRF